MNAITSNSASNSIIILTKQRSHFLPRRHSLRFTPITCTTTSSNSDDADSNSNSSSVQSPAADPGVGVKFRRRSSSRRQSKLQRENNSNNKNGAAAMQSSAPKRWEEMSLTEKAVELYMGEKGALFWLNKFAYASIFIMIGAWIAFRFVGPALNLYQLDAPPLSPSDVLKGSPPPS